MLVQAPNRRVRLASTWGAIRWMEPNEERDFEGPWLKLAVEAGCKKVVAPPKEEAPSKNTAGEAIVTPDLNLESVLEERKARIQAAIRELVERGDESAFTSTGQPRVREVAVIIGGEVTKRDIEDAFASMEV